MHTRDQLSSRVGRKACSKNFLEAKKTKLEQKVQSLSGWIPSMSIGRERPKQMANVNNWQVRKDKWSLIFHSCLRCTQC